MFLNMRVWITCISDSDLGARNGFYALEGGQQAGRGWVLSIRMALELFDLAFLSCLHGSFEELKNTHRKFLAFTLLPTFFM